MKNRGLGRLVIRLFTINTYKHVGFGVPMVVIFSEISNVGVMVYINYMCFLIVW